MWRSTRVMVHFRAIFWDNCNFQALHRRLLKYTSVLDLVMKAPIQLQWVPRRHGPDRDILAVTVR